MSELAYLGLADAAALIKAGELSPVEYCDHLIQRAQKLQPQLAAYLQLDADAAMDAARAAEQAVADNADLPALHGVPFALKDIIDAQGLRTTAHSAILKDNVATQDAAVTMRLRGAGGVLLGKTATHEFAFGGPCFDLPWPPARNPWDTRMFPGGSSSGSGAAVAAGLAPLALGTDTGGSVRNPASMCGLVGIKPTYGRVSRRGVVPLSFSLDHVGPLTRSVMDNALALGVLSGHDKLDPASAPDDNANFLSGVLAGQRDSLSGLRVGVIRHFYREDLIASDEVTSGIEQALSVLESLGASIEEVRTRPLSEFADGNRVILLSEAYAVHEQWMRERPADYAQMTREKLLPGAFLRAVDYVQAVRNRPGFTAQIDTLLDDVDILITASSMEPPFLMDDPEAVARCYPRQARTPFNLTGHPALVLPVGFTGDEKPLPLSMQMVGRHFDETMLYRVAAAYEQATQWNTRRPPLDVSV
jgi:aspartyl-tRNA(Asn)/glutamyl-tRNA(Gln) amidotransferase subunit A